MFRWLALIVCLLFLPATAFAQAEQLTASFKRIHSSSNAKLYQLIKCDQVPTLTGADGPENGESCLTGDWSKPVDCTDHPNLTLMYWEYGTGSGDVSFWNCILPPGSATKIGEEDPETGPGPADFMPLCNELTTGVAGNMMDGTDAADPENQRYSLAGFSMHYIVARIEDCTTNCDGIVAVSCSR